MNGTYKQPRRGHAPRTFKRNAAGQFVTTGSKPMATGEARLKTIREKAQALTDIMLEMTGVPRDKFMHSRQAPLPMCRAILYQVLYKDNYSTSMIGTCFGRNHSTVLHGLGTLRDLLTIGDRETVALFDQFNELNKTAI